MVNNIKKSSNKSCLPKNQAKNTSIKLFAKIDKMIKQNWLYLQIEKQKKNFQTSILAYIKTGK